MGHIARQSESMQPDRDFLLRLLLPGKESHRQRISAEDNLLERLSQICRELQGEPAFKCTQNGAAITYRK